jgi:hypothetical protein
VPLFFHAVELLEELFTIADIPVSLPYILEIGRGRAPIYAENQLKNPRPPRDSASHKRLCTVVKFLLE